MRCSISTLRQISIPPVLWLALLLASPASTVTLVPIADTSIFEKAPDNNLGATQSFAAGNTATPDPARALIRFDLSTALPAGARVTGVSLTLPVVRTARFPEPATFGLHRLLVDWGEGDKGENVVIGIGALASAGEVTWTARFHAQQSWAVPGGGAGLDFTAQASGSASITGTLPLVFEFTTDLVADVQSWLDNPGSNFGWLLKDQFESIGSTARRFGSREHPTDRPLLVVEYEAPLRIDRISLIAGQYCLHFTARAGRTYKLERRDNVDSENWEVIATRLSSEGTAEAVLCDTIAPTSSRFYRIGEE